MYQVGHQVGVDCLFRVILDLSRRSPSIAHVYMRTYRLLLFTKVYILG